MFTNRRAKIELPITRVQSVYIWVVRIICVLISLFDEDEVNFVFYMSGCVVETSPTRQLHTAIDRTVPVEAARAGPREATAHVHRSIRHRVLWPPNRVVRPELVVDNRGLRFE